jgi:hypothetical protein
MDWMTKKLGFDTREGQEIFLFSIALRPVLGLHLASYTGRDVSLGVKWQE